MPVVGPTIRDAMFGSGFFDFILRFYTLHVFILPIVMLGLMAVHLPRFLVFDVPMVMAISGAVLVTGGVFPVDLGSKFQPTVPPGITVPEWYLTGIYAFLRTQYDKYVTGVLWPGLFIVALAMTPFIDRYKKFSWKDRPIITAFGITGITQVMVTTYWGFYITPDTTKPLVARLVIDPIFFYVIMLLLVPIGFAFSYMMILLAKESERKAKLAAAKGPHKVATINFSGKWINWLIVALLLFQVFLNIAAYNAALGGMKNFNLFLTGLILMTFAGMFHLYRHGLNEAKKAPPPPPQQAEPAKPLGGPEPPAVTPPKEGSAGKSSQPPSAVAPEIKTAAMDDFKDPMIGKSDLRNN
jgi:ubiquinol-cytochrome c reductase cytochrome b subunit